jgi:hypothetical protein
MEPVLHVVDVSIGNNCPAHQWGDMGYSPKDIGSNPIRACFNRYTILNLRALLSNNLPPDPSASVRLRRIPVSIHGTVYTPTQPMGSVRANPRTACDTSQTDQ